jgi:hypothetical protein
MLKEFLNFNTHCPSCKNPLTLFMRWSGDIIDNDYRLFRFHHKPNENIAFREIKQDNKYPQNSKHSLGINGIIYPNTNSITFNTTSAEKIIQNQDSIYFFFICNPSSIEYLSNDYEINVYDSCYFRSSFPVKFVKNDNRLCPTYIEPPGNHIANEHFTILDKKENSEKVYVLTVSHEDNKTYLMYYSVDNEQTSDEAFTPKVFTKELPLLKTSPDPSDKDKLLERMNSWIIMS